ncbi:MAG: VOC family protein [Thermoplasmata archaeon]
MPAKYLSYAGIRVTQLERSVRFYTQAFGLVEVQRGDNSTRGKGIFVLLRDPWSGQKLELNWYPPGSEFATPYQPGEGLDHIAFRVANLPQTLEELKKAGVERVGGSADHTLPGGARVAYVKDPDGNWIELYDHPTQMIPEKPPPGY